MREFYLNADFDHSLLGQSSLLETSDPTYLHEMAWHFLFAGDPVDSVIVHAPLPGGFAAYAAAKGLALPHTVLHPEFTARAEFVPFGWNAQALALASRYDAQPTGMDLPAVKTANSRAFAVALERQWYPESASAGFHEDFPRMLEYLATRDPSESWVAKGNHGFAAIANRRVQGGALAAGETSRLAALFEAHRGLVLEPWHDRLVDMAVLFRVGSAGAVEDFRGHILINSRDGAFLGVEVAPDGLPPAAWREALRANADRLAKALADLGYFGPVGVDAYVHRTSAGPRLRPLVDVNARLSMALPAHGLARRLPGRFIRWSWHKPRKLLMPGSYADLDARLGDAAFDARRGEGILAVSPLFREDDPGLRPKRVGFALVAESEAGVGRLRTAFQKALGRGP